MPYSMGNIHQISLYIYTYIVAFCAVRSFCWSSHQIIITKNKGDCLEVTLVACFKFINLFCPNLNADCCSQGCYDMWRLCWCREEGFRQNGRFVHFFLTAYVLHGVFNTKGLERFNHYFKLYSSCYSFLNIVRAGPVQKLKLGTLFPCLLLY